ncbi:hypothetical protein [Halomonas sp.]|uniref:hypothetical protein n=1 Tax=Halomonas sp. TaxID=1486246 RepID=UPI00257D9CDA|nr:hypothetical protein [Halomonas sp.]MCJ8285129.1 hypothetical protein [Halomonas sp.]NQY70179.1 hypothetical protein [Halomonas sp.]
MTTYPDETLEYYAERFIRLRLSRHGLSLAQYLANVEYGERLALNPEPPLPAQQGAILRLWAEQDTGLAAGSPSPSTRLEPHWSDAQLQDWRELLAHWRHEGHSAEREVAHLPQRNGAVIEPLRHTCHPRRPGAAFFNKRGA